MAQLEETETQLVTQKTESDVKIDERRRRVDDRTVRVVYYIVTALLMMGVVVF